MIDICSTGGICCEGFLRPGWGNPFNWRARSHEYDEKLTLVCVRTEATVLRSAARGLSI
jgi:hypothetical protein